MRILVVATKPPHPPFGGGNVVLSALLAGLRERGSEVRVVSLSAAGGARLENGPGLQVAVASPRPWHRLTASFLRGESVLLQRYLVPELARAVESVARSYEPHVIHLEQLHLGWLIPRLRHRWPVLLRQQNVESLLVARLAPLLAGPRGWALRREARVLSRAEARWAEEADLTAAISERDRDHLQAMAPGALVRALPPAWRPPAAVAPLPLEGDPPILCLGSFDWLPNRDGAAWFLQRGWHRLRALCPGAILHLAGPGSESLAPGVRAGVRRYGRVESASCLYAPGVLQVIPVRAASGVRVRLLESWWAGIPAVTTTVGGEGLVEDDGDGALLADGAEELAERIADLLRDEPLRRRLVQRGRARLAAFDHQRVAAAAEELYRETRSRWLENQGMSPQLLAAPLT